MTATPILEAPSERSLAGNAGICLIRIAELAQEAPSVDVAVERAQKVAQLGALVSASPTLRVALREALETPTPGRTLSGQEAAARLGMIGTDGKPTDKFYNQAAPKMGHQEGKRWIIPEENLERYRRGEAA